MWRSHPEFAVLRTTKMIDGDTLDGLVHRGLHVGRAVDAARERAAAGGASERREVRRPAARAAAARSHGHHRRSIHRRRTPADHGRRDQARDLLRVDRPAARRAVRGRDRATGRRPTTSSSESFEQTVLMQIRERGVPGRIVFLAESAGSPADLVARWGGRAHPVLGAPHRRRARAPADRGRRREVDKTLLLRVDAAGAPHRHDRPRRPRARRRARSLHLDPPRREPLSRIEPAPRPLPPRLRRLGDRVRPDAGHRASTVSSPTSPTSCSTCSRRP